MSRDPVTVATFPTVAEAQTVRGILEEAGIRTWVQNAQLPTVEPWWQIAIGGVALAVVPEDAARAAEILRLHEEEVRAARAFAEEAFDGGEDSCVACGVSFPAYLERCPGCGLSYG